MIRRGAALAVLVVLVATATASIALAHPLGNFTTNIAVRLVVGPDQVQVRYVLDLAEIPTVQVRQRIDADDNGEIDDDEAAAFARTRCEEALDALTLRAGSTDLEPALEVPSLSFPEGQAGLATTRLVCDAVVSDVAVVGTLSVEDTSAPDRIGWREISAVGDRMTLTGDVPTTSPTRLLRAYPDAATASPLRVSRATIDVAPGGSPAPADALDPVDAGDAGDREEGLVEGLTRRYTELVAARELTPAFVVVAVLLAMLLGASHAVAPGHGKTVMAAYVVAERGTPRLTLAIGATVAVTHTLGTLLLGAVLQASETLAPERLYPVFGVVSGALIVAIGAGLLRSAWRRRSHDHTHDHDHDHDHTHDHGHDADDHGAHDHDPHEHVTHDGGTAVLHHHGHTHVLPDPDMGWRRLVTLGVAGGLAPSPSALLVLLGAIALGRTALGVGLVAAYGIGLAAVLVGIGLLLVRFRGVAERLLDRRAGGRAPGLRRALPFVTGAAVVLGGFVVAVRGLVG